MENFHYFFLLLSNTLILCLVSIFPPVFMELGMTDSKMYKAVGALQLEILAIKSTSLELEEVKLGQRALFL